eukprot:2737967-Prymnesium_polylepis.1
MSSRRTRAQAHARRQRSEQRTLRAGARRPHIPREGAPAGPALIGQIDWENDDGAAARLVRAMMKQSFCLRYVTEERGKPPRFQLHKNPWAYY